MNPAQNTNIKDDNNKTTPVSQTPVSSTSGKEKEAFPSSASENISSVAQEVVLSKEVEKAGVEVIKDTIELPPDVKKLGVSTVGTSAPVAVTATLPPVSLPLSDQQVILGLHAQVISSFRWLAVWCVKQLKKAHIALKNIHGKIVRVKT